MRRFAAHILVLAAVMLAFFALRHAPDSIAQTGPPPGGPPRQGSPPPPFTAVPPDSFAAERDSMEKAVLRKIAGKESAPADSVFDNIKLFKGMPAGRMLRIMNVGWGKSLGVGCLHCHVKDDWDSEDKAAKQVARDMAAMTRTIGSELLPKIKNLRSEQPTVNCTTCHRGQKRPATNI
jgi:hypothetical protein